MFFSLEAGYCRLHTQVDLPGDPATRSCPPLGAEGLVHVYRVPQVQPPAPEPGPEPTPAPMPEQTAAPPTPEPTPEPTPPPTPEPTSVPTPGPTPNAGDDDPDLPRDSKAVAPGLVGALAAGAFAAFASFI